jgi:hypothetical protein
LKPANKSTLLVKGTTVSVLPRQADAYSRSQPGHDEGEVRTVSHFLSNFESLISNFQVPGMFLFRHSRSLSSLP